MRLVNVKIKTGKNYPFRRTMARAESICDARFLCFSVDSNRGSGRLHRVNNMCRPTKNLICFLFNKRKCFTFKLRHFVSICTQQQNIGPTILLSKNSEVVFCNFHVWPKEKLFWIPHYRSRLFVAWDCLENKLCWNSESTYRISHLIRHFFFSILLSALPSNITLYCCYQ